MPSSLPRGCFEGAVKGEALTVTSATPSLLRFRFLERVGVAAASAVSASAPAAASAAPANASAACCAVLDRRDSEREGWRCTSTRSPSRRIEMGCDGSRLKPPSLGTMPSAQRRPPSRKLLRSHAERSPMHRSCAGTSAHDSCSGALGGTSVAQKRSRRRTGAAATIVATHVVEGERAV